MSTVEKLGCPLAPLEAPLAPLDPLAPVEPLAPLEALPLLGDEALLLLGEVVEELLPPEALPEALSSGLLLLAPALEPLPELLPPVEELELCAEATLAIAKSAAAVAVPTTFNNI